MCFVHISTENQALVHVLPELSLLRLPFLFSASAGDNVWRPKSAPGRQEAPEGTAPARLGVLAHRLGPPGATSEEPESGTGMPRPRRVLTDEALGICGMCQLVC